MTKAGTHIMQQTLKRKFNFFRNHCIVTYRFSWN